MLKAFLPLLVTALVLVTADVYAARSEVRTSRITEAGSDISWGHAVGVIEKPIDEILPVVLDYGNYARFMPYFTRSQVLAQRGTRAMAYMEVRIAGGTITLWAQVELSETALDENAKLVEAKLIDGNVNAFRARWRLTPVEEGASTEIEFKMYVDPDLPLPPSLFSRQNERAAGKMVRALYSRVMESAERS